MVAMNETSNKLVRIMIILVTFLQLSFGVQTIGNVEKCANVTSFPFWYYFSTLYACLVEISMVYYIQVVGLYSSML